MVFKGIKSYLVFVHQNGNIWETNIQMYTECDLLMSCDLMMQLVNAPNPTILFLVSLEKMRNNCSIGFCSYTCQSQ